MMICLFFSGWAFFVFATPSACIYEEDVVASTYYGRQPGFDKPAEGQWVEVHIDHELNLVEYNYGKVVTIQADGEKKSFVSDAFTVKDLLNEQEIKLMEHDEINLPVDEPLSDQDQVIIKRVKYRDTTKVVQIPYKILHQQNDWIYNGLKVVWRPGETGKKRQYFRERFEDGKSVSTTLMREELIASPVDEIIAHGTLVFDGPYVKKLPMLASSYNPTVEQCGPNPFVTFSGLRVRYGIVATDPEVIPLGTWLYVSGYGYALAADIGGLIKGNRIDCFFWTSHVGSGWRGGHIYVYILEGKPEGGLGF